MFFLWFWKTLLILSKWFTLGHFFLLLQGVAFTALRLDMAAILTWTSLEKRDAASYKCNIFQIMILQLHNRWEQDWSPVYDGKYGIGETTIWFDQALKLPPDLIKLDKFDEIICYWNIWSNQICYWNIWSNQIAAQKYGLRSQRLGGREPAGKLNLIYCPHLLINPSWWVFSTIQLALSPSFKTYKKWLESWFIFFLLNLYTKIMIS